MIDARLITLITLLEEKSYTATAQKLNFTQPAITHHIKAIEKEYDISLFENSKTFELTKAGKILLDYAKESKIRYEQLLNNFKKQSSEVVRIGITEMISSSILETPFMNEVRHTLPRYNLYNYTTTTIQDKILNGELDLGVIDSSFDSQSFESLYLYSNKIVIVVKPDGQFTKNRITRELLLSSVVIIGDKDSGLYKTTMGTLHNKNIRLNHNIILESNNPEMIASLVCNNDAIGFMYEDGARAMERLGRIKVVELLNFKPIQNTYLIYNRFSFLDEGAQALLDRIKKLGE